MERSGWTFRRWNWMSVENHIFYRNSSLMYWNWDTKAPEKTQNVHQAPVVMGSSGGREKSYKYWLSFISPTYSQATESLISGWVLLFIFLPEYLDCLHKLLETKLSLDEPLLQYCYNLPRRYMGVRFEFGDLPEMCWLGTEGNASDYEHRVHRKEGERDLYVV